MLSLQEFNALSNIAKSEYLRVNFPVNSFSQTRRRSVFGFGVNNADYMSGPKIDGKKANCPAYVAWRDMIKRSYCPKWHARHPTYIGVSVCEEWHSFLAFRAWWIANQIDGWQLDKDLLGNSREYSPESCIFVPQWLNNFTIDSGAARGNCPIGADWHKSSGKYRARCSRPFGKNEHLGNFTSAEDAHAAWKSRKLEIAEELRPRMDEIDLRIYPRVVEIISRAK